MTITTPTSTVMAIGQINLSGNITPASWWRHITLPSGRPDQTAITLLSEIVYWYRPAEVRNEVTGALVGYRKRFHGDKLQRSYQAFADQFGFSKRETADALKRLRNAGFITLELRTVQTSEGMILNNVLFIEPMPEAIHDINSMVRKSDIKNATPIPFKRNTPSVSTEAPLRSDVSVPTLKSETYTEITTGDIPPNPQEGGEAPASGKAKINYQVIADAFNEILGDRLPKAQGLNEKRRRGIKRLLSELHEPTFEAASAYFEAFGDRAKPFYFGDNDTGWRASFDYLLRSDTLVKTREGSL